MIVAVAAAAAAISLDHHRPDIGAAGSPRSAGTSVAESATLESLGKVGNRVPRAARVEGRRRASVSPRAGQMQGQHHVAAVTTVCTAAPERRRRPRTKHRARVPVPLRRAAPGEASSLLPPPPPCPRVASDLPCLMPGGDSDLAP